MTPGPIDVPPDWARAAFSSDPNPSFTDLLRRVDPASLPQMPVSALPMIPATGTTIVSLTYAGGIVMAGDRRATEGHNIADRRMEKVFPADDHSAIAIAGAAGPAIDMVRLLQMEIEHYEKIEGERLSLEGKANRLASMIKMNFPMLMQGIVVVPIFGGYDVRRGIGRIFRYDAVGGRYEEASYHATGSGGVHARGTLKKRFHPGMSSDDAVRAAVESILDAAEEDAATGAPDPAREIYPVVAVVGEPGYERVADERLKTITTELLAERGRA